MAATCIERPAAAARPPSIRDLSFDAAAAAAPLPVRPRAGRARCRSSSALTTAQWLGIFVTYMLLSGEDLGFWAEIGALLGVYVAHQHRHGARSRSRSNGWCSAARSPGVYPLWGVYYFRWWFAQRASQPLVHIKWLQGSPVMRVLPAPARRQGRRATSSSPTIEAGAIDLIDDRRRHHASASKTKLRQCRGRSATS